MFARALLIRIKGELEPVPVDLGKRESQLQGNMQTNIAKSYLQSIH